MEKIEVIPGGVTAARGFKASGVHCGIRRNTSKKDLALIFAEVECNAAAVYTTNRVKAAPIYVTMEHLRNGKARAILANSGNANACTADGAVNARRMCAAAAAALGIGERDIIVNSTGVIGVPLPVEAVEAAVPALVSALSGTGSADAELAIMTTDLVPKSIAVRFVLDGKECILGGIAKGSGMIHPNMATMFSFLTTDAAISADMLQKALRESAHITYNRISVDGDTSTNDMNAILASGLCGNPEITQENAAYAVFRAALDKVNLYLAKEMARDGEGATKLVTCIVAGADTEEKAAVLAKSVVASSLVKTAMFGADANWGREMCAMGYSGAEFDPLTVGITFSSDAGSLEVCRDGCGIPFDESAAKTVLSRKEVFIRITLREGEASAEAFGCDLSYDYVKINGDYRS